MVCKIKKRKQFNWIFKNGENVSTKLVSLVFCKTKTRGCLIGYSVSKKIGKAVTRNKVKRRMKEAVKKFSPNFENRYSYIFVAKSGIENATFIDICNNIEEVVKKAGKFKI